MKKTLSSALFFVSLYLVLVPAPAHAYLDPGTGSYILQVLAAVFFAGLFVLKTWWNQVRGFVLKLFGRKENDSKKSSKKD
ncbi:MAG: hypothetical protein ACHQT7_01020 [Candidatus Levyibacteriota bacterium]